MDGVFDVHEVGTFRDHQELINQSIRITDLVRGEIELFSLEFEKSDIERFFDFIEFVQEMRETKFCQESKDTSITLFCDASGALQFKCTLPSDEVFADLLMKLRPFILENEATYFYLVLNKINRQIRMKCMTDVFITWKNLFSGKSFQSHMWIEVSGFDRMMQVEGKDTFVLNSGQFVDRWLNAKEFHRDKKKRQFIDNLNKLLPAPFIKSIFELMIFEKVKALYSLDHFVRFLCGQQNDFTYMREDKSPCILLERIDRQNIETQALIVVNGR